MRVAAFLLVFSATAAFGAGRGSVIYAGGSWAAIDRGAVCEAVARFALITERGKVQAIASLSFTPDHKRWGEFYARLSRPVRTGSSVILNIGGQPFLLLARGDDAWSRGGLQEQAIIIAMRSADSMRIEARDAGGRRFFDPYALDGAPTSIDAAAARCAGKSQ